MSIRILVGKSIINIFSVYAPQTCLSVIEKDSFYSALLTNISTVSHDEYLLVCGDFNGHIGKAPEGFSGVHGGRGFGSGNADGTKILDLCTTANLPVTKAYFMKPDSHLVTYRSGHSCTQVDYIVTRRSDLKQVQNLKVIGNEECVTQHKLLVCEINLRTQIRKQHKPPPKRRIWKLRKSEVQEKYKKAVEASINSLTLLSDPDSEADVSKSIWIEIKSCLINVCGSVCGWTKGNCKRERETWWDETVESLVKQKRKLWKEWQKGGSKEKYLVAKSKAKSGVYVVKEKFIQLESSDGKNFIFKLAKRMQRETQDIVGKKCMKNDKRCITYNDSAKVKARKSHYERLLNV